MSRSKYYSNQFATIQGEATSSRQDQAGGNFLKGFVNVLSAVAPVALDIGKNVAIHQLTKGRGSDNLKQNRSGGSFGNAALQVGSIPSTSHGRDLRATDPHGGKGGGSAKRVSCPSGYRYKR